MSHIVHDHDEATVPCWPAAGSGVSSVPTEGARPGARSLWELLGTNV